MMTNRSVYFIAFTTLLTSQACFSSMQFCSSSAPNYANYSLHKKGTNELVLGKYDCYVNSKRDKKKDSVFGEHKGELDSNFLGSSSYNLKNEKLFITTSKDGETKLWKMTNNEYASNEKIKESIKLVQTVKIKRPEGWKDGSSRFYLWEKDKEKTLPNLALFFHFQTKNKNWERIKQLIDLKKGKLISEKMVWSSEIKKEKNKQPSESDQENVPKFLDSDQK